MRVQCSHASVGLAQAWPNHGYQVHILNDLKFCRFITRCDVYSVRFAIPYVIFRFVSIYNACISICTYVDDVWFSLNHTTYQNNSVVTLEDIGDNNFSLLCVANSSACCRYANWFFPNGTRVPSSNITMDFYRTRGQMVVKLHRRRGGEDGIYRCEIPDAMNVTQTIYIGVYTAGNGE